MNFLALLTTGSVLLAAVCAAPPNLKIFNGEDADIKDFPYMVNLYYKPGFQSFCGGSILNENTILTAAHCLVILRTTDFIMWLKPEEVEVRFGNADYTKADVTNVTKIIVPDAWTHNSRCPRDIALLKVDPPLVFSNTVKPIKLPQLNEATPENKLGVVTGWGVNETYQIPTILQKVNVTIVNDNVCKGLWADITVTCPVDSKYDMCAQTDMSDGKPRGQCSGDSGGPLVINGTQYGIVAHHYGSCGNPDIPPVFTKVSGLVDWVEDKL